MSSGAVMRMTALEKRYEPIVSTSNHLTGCAADIRVSSFEQAIRYAAILLDYADESHQDFDELLIEKNRFGAIWLHFAVRFRDNRHKVLYINA